MASLAFCFFFQYVQQDGHESGLCNHGHRAAPPAQGAAFVGHFGPGTPAPMGGGPVQSYGGRLRSPLVWPVPGNGNDRYHQQGYLDPGAGAARSEGLRGHRRGFAAPAGASASSGVFVDYGAGSDGNAGTSIGAPLKTIAAAVAKAAGMAAPVTVHLVGTSTHYVADTIKLTAAHSGLTITGGDSDAVVSGGVAFAGAWKAAGNTSDGKAVIYTTPVPKGLSFLELFNTSTSARYVPAREPNGNPERDQNNYGLSAANWLPARDFGKATLVQNGSYVDPSGKNVTINRGGMFDQYYMGVGGPADNFVPSISYWAQAAPRGGGASTYTIPSGMQVGKEQKLASGGKDGFVFMMQTHAWGSWVYEIASTAANPDGSTKLTFGKGGQQEARGTGSPQVGGGTFYLSHRREFLDVAGEWYLDQGKGELSLAVPAGGTPPAELVAPVVQQLVVVEGTQAAPVDNVRLTGITFRHAAPTYMADQAVGSGGDYAVFRGGAVHLNGTTNCMVDHNLFDGVGGNGVWLTDYNRHASVAANEMRHIGENGVGMRGSTEWVDGRGGNQPRFSSIQGNLIHHLGLYTKQACAVFSAVACQNNITDNIMFHGPRALVNMNDGFGGDTVIRRNLFFASLLETSDHGPYVDVASAAIHTIPVPDGAVGRGVGAAKHTPPFSVPVLRVRPLLPVLRVRPLPGTTRGTASRS